MMFASYPEPDCWQIRQGSPEIHAEKPQMLHGCPRISPPFIMALAD